MGASKQMKTAKLGIVLQLTDVTGGAGGRTWIVHDVERNRGFRVHVTVAALDETRPGESRPPGGWTEDVVRGAVGVSVEKFLLASPELVAGPLLEVEVTSADLYEFARLANE